METDLGPLLSTVPMTYNYIIILNSKLLEKGPNAMPVVGFSLLAFFKAYSPHFDFTISRAEAKNMLRGGKRNRY